MVDKKELFDYLRNTQKSAEIQAKVDGINLWVLLAAIAIVAWQLIGYIDSQLWPHYALILRALLCAEAVCWLVWLGDDVASSGEDVRYAQVSVHDLDSPFLFLLQGVMLLGPPLALIASGGLCVGVIVFALIGVVWASIPLVSIFAKLAGIQKKEEKFPSPDFGLTSQGDVIFRVVFGVLAIGVIVEQFIFYGENVSLLSAEMVRLIASATTLYTLLMVLVVRTQKSNRIAWTYQLETDLLLGVVTPEVAARKIELRGLGPRVQDVMNRHFEDFDDRLGRLDSLIAECIAKIESIKDVPKEYGAEREARFQTATKPVLDHINTLKSECVQFSQYLGKIVEKIGRKKDGKLHNLIEGLFSRNRAYEEKLAISAARMFVVLDGPSPSSDTRRK